MKAVIMAGGEGTRLRPLTALKPKPLVPILNKPVIKHIISLLNQNGIGDIAITLQYLPEKIKECLKGEKVRYYVENVPLGTAGSVGQARDFLDETFVVISGDCMCNIDLKAAIESHYKSGAKVSIVVKKVDSPLEYGVVIRDEMGFVKRFLEKPTYSEVFSDEVNTGIYIIEPEIFDFVPSGKVMDFSKDLFPLLLEKKIKINTYLTNEYWCDIGDISSYAQCQKDLLTVPYAVGENTIIEDGVVIHNNTVIGGGCHIASGTVIEESIIWDNVTIKEQCTIKNSIVCSGVIIKKHTLLQPGTVVGEDSIVGQNVIIRDNVKVYNNKQVADFTTLWGDLVYGNVTNTLTFSSQYLCGEVGVDITAEMVCKLGQILPIIMGEKSRIGISTNNKNAAKMIKQSIIAGLLSAGAIVTNFDVQPASITRSGIRFYNLSGGVHINQEDDKIKIVIMNQYGNNITRQDERKIEALYSRGDIVKSKTNDIKDIITINSYKYYYLREIVNKCKNSKIEFNVFLCIKDPLIKSIFISVLSELKCKFYISSKVDIDDVPKEIKQNNYKLGAYVDELCENVVLFDEYGNRIDDSMQVCLDALVQFKTRPSSTFIADMTAPSAIEDLSQKYMCKVKREKGDIIPNMSNTLKGFNLTDQYIQRYDALVKFVSIIDFLKSHTTTLSQMINDIPNFYIKSGNIECDNSKKGLMVKKLINTNKDAVLNDGVKIFENGGWVHVKPHNYSPKCDIVAEGHNEEFAQELIQKYTEILKALT